MTANPARVATSDQPTRILTASEIVERLAVGLGVAAWHLDTEIDEMELVLPGTADRPAALPWPLVSDHIYVRLDAETHAALSVIIPAWTWWLREQTLPADASPASPAAPDALDAALPASDGLQLPARRTALDGLVQYLRAHTADLTDAVAEDSGPVAPADT